MRIHAAWFDDVHITVEQARERVGAAVARVWSALENKFGAEIWRECLGDSVADDWAVVAATVAPEVFRSAAVALLNCRQCPELEDLSAWLEVNALAGVDSVVLDSVGDVSVDSDAVALPVGRGDALHWAYRCHSKAAAREVIVCAEKRRDVRFGAVVDFLIDVRKLARSADGRLVVNYAGF